MTLLNYFEHTVFSTKHLPTEHTLFPYTTLFRSRADRAPCLAWWRAADHTIRAQSSWDDDNRRLRSRARRQRLPAGSGPRSEEHTSELQSRRDLVCRLLLEKKKKHI